MAQFRFTALATLVSLMFAAVTVCSSLRTHNDYDPGIRFDNYESFAWGADKAANNSRRGDDSYISPLYEQRIVRAIESELFAKGYRQVQDSSTADYVVSFTVGAREKIDIDSYPAGVRDRWVRHWPYYGFYETIEVHTYTEDMLAIDIYDRASSSPAWHGVARKRIVNADAGRRGELIQESVAAILSGFPPDQ